MEQWKETFSHMINCTTVDVYEIFDLVNANIPNKLYKYASFNEHWRTLIFKGQVYTELPANFNDPFDSSSYYDKEKLLYWLKHNIADYKAVSKKSKPHKDTVDKILLDYATFLPTTYELLYKYGCRVSCFSESNNSVLMWSHYANKHTGFCVEFDMDKVNQFILPIIYNNEIRQVQLHKTHSLIDPFVFAPYLYKSNEWSYEKEWRIFVDSQTFSAEDIENRKTLINLKDAISALYLGLKADVPQSVLNWAKNNNIKLFKMKMDAQYYTIFPERISNT